MTSMRIEFTEQIALWISKQTESGAFGSQSEVVQHCVRTYIHDNDPRHFAKPAAPHEAADGSLVDQIVDAVGKGAITEPFGFDDIFSMFGQRFSEKSLRTCLANFAVDETADAKGYHVAQGRKPRFLRVGRGQYMVFRAGASKAKR